MLEIAEQLAQSNRACIIAPAGFGKTYQIAKAISYCTGRKQLILTHTHAGVRSIREKLKRLGISQKSFEVDTIAGWCLRLTSAFPGLSGLEDFEPTGHSWNSVYCATTNALTNTSLKKIIQATYDGIFVDEYQDCTHKQHNLILELANLLSCRVLGDPLQGIFGFDKNDQLVDWDIDVYTNFMRLDDLTVPWRWNNSNNPVLGNRLYELRFALENSQPFDLRLEPINWFRNTREIQIYQCKRMLGRNNESVVAIHSMPNQCNSFAQMLKGTYNVMETLDCDDLMKAVYDVETLQGYSRALRVIEFASKCMTQVTSALKSTLTSFERGKLVIVTAKTPYPDLVSALNLVIAENNISKVVEAMPLFRTINDSFLYRQELWYEMLRSLRAFVRGGFETTQEAAWNIRNITREQGRRLDLRVVARTLLVKGLEFDHAIILNADSMDKKNLYVAMTRGAKSLTVLSDNPVIQK